jgi:hypothetical protein
MAAFGDLRPSTACLFQMRGLFWREDKANHQGFSQAGDREGIPDCVEE